ncbi:hypothetical protein K439DRAFT_251806 [Ramaria rubella]|nr:hypothetical protein K439DRAFT_251806 [Ramaria rubella]
MWPASFFGNHLPSLTTLILYVYSPPSSSSFWEHASTLTELRWKATSLPLVECLSILGRLPHLKYLTIPESSYGNSPIHPPIHISSLLCLDTVDIMPFVKIFLGSIHAPNLTNATFASWGRNPNLRDVFESLSLSSLFDRIKVVDLLVGTEAYSLSGMAVENGDVIFSIYSIEGVADILGNGPRTVFELTHHVFDLFPKAQVVSNQGNRRDGRSDDGVTALYLHDAHIDTLRDFATLEIFPRLETLNLCVQDYGNQVEILVRI